MSRPTSDSNPPFAETYKALFDSSSAGGAYWSHGVEADEVRVMEEVELPLTDLRRLRVGDVRERQNCRVEIAKASKEWGFFRVINHGISSELLDAIRVEQTRLFREPFSNKVNDAYMNMSPGSYRWGAPYATCLSQLSWSEAFHIPLDDIQSLCNPLSWLMGEFATKVSELAQDLASILAESLGHESTFFKEHCLPRSCYLRMNRYPPYPNSSQLFGLMPHTDSDFLTILHEDQVGGLQFVKDGRWIAVKPHSEALIINIGDLFQAWSNGAYKSVEHRVVANEKVERFSTAYFFCPSHDAVIPSCREPRVYREFNFKEYREQVQSDVKNLGYKIGLSHFLCSDGRLDQYPHYS